MTAGRTGGREVGGGCPPREGPEGPGRDFLLTFVCTGNTCRSPMAEAIARRIIADAGIAAVRVGSAGTHVWPGQPASEGALGAARRAGLDLTSHSATLLTAELVTGSDLVLCMGTSHLRRVQELGGAHSGHLLTGMAGAEGDIPDPYGGDRELYDAVFAEIERMVRGVLTGADSAVGGGGEGGGEGDPAIYAVLGDPVSHSLSPAIHNAAFRAAGRNARYIARQVAAGECGAVLRELALAGGGGNVTIPHKERVLPFLDRPSAAVDATGACNTFWSEAGEVWGDNTDVAGFLRTWRRVTAAAGNDLEVLLLGAGGAARAVVHALLGCGEVGRIRVRNRSSVKAAALMRHFQDPRIALAPPPSELSPDAVINATSVGMDGRRSPLDLATLDLTPACVVDLVYARLLTPFCNQAITMGAKAVDGREMLVHQAEEAYARWFGEPPPKGAMSRALD